MTSNYSRRMIILTILIAVVGIAGIAVMYFQINSISDKYSSLITNNYTNQQYMDEINQQIYCHQALVYKYIGLTNDTDKIEINKQVLDYEDSINKTLAAFGTNVKGTAYENLYHSIYSCANGYFVNISHVFTFLDSGDINTANYYIDLAMEDGIAKLTGRMDELSSLIASDTESAHTSLYMHLRSSSILAIICTTVIILFALYCVIFSANIAKKMK